MAGRVDAAAAEFQFRAVLRDGHRHRLVLIDGADLTAPVTIEEGRLGVVVTFLAILELMKGALLEMVQAEPFGTIHVKGVSN